MDYELLLWASVFGVLYTYFFYPILLFSFSWSKRRISAAYSSAIPSNESSDRPSVAVIIAAYNEEKHIIGRIENLLSQNYDQDRLSIYIGSDGSDDKTCELIESLAHPKVRLFAFKERRGKVAVINDLIQAAEEELIVMTDANTDFHPLATRHLVRHFTIDEIGAVCGELKLLEVGESNNKDSLYWRYEQFLKHHEGVLGGLLGANGGIYAFRKSLYKPLPTDTIVDDFTIVMRIALDGYKVVYDIEASATEETAPCLEDEYKRRVRIGMGNYQAVVRLLGGFHPRHGWLWFTYMSHKVGRWLVPHALFIILICSVLLSYQWIYAGLMMVQIAIYSLVWFAPRLFSQRPMPAAIMILSFFVKMNIALGHGFIKWCLPGGSGVWSRTPR